MNIQTKAYLLSWPVSCLISAITMTNSHETLGGRDLFPLVKAKQKNFIFAFWHSRLMVPIHFYRHADIGALISQSKDGEYITQVAERFGFKVARGSASRRGVGGFKGVRSMLNKGQSILITPDGPRGPRETVQMGVIQLAKSTGIPVTPVSFSCTRHIRAKSWDRFMIPLPFGKIVTVIGQDIIVEPDANEEQLQQKRLEVQKEIRRVTRVADDYVGAAFIPYPEDQA